MYWEVDSPQCGLNSDLWVGSILLPFCPSVFFPGRDMGPVEVGPKTAAVKAKCHCVDQAQYKWRVTVAGIKSIQEKEVGLKAWHCPLPDAQQHFAVPAHVACSGDSGIGFWPCSCHHQTVLAFSLLPWRAQVCTNLSLQISVKLSISL